MSETTPQTNLGTVTAVLSMALQTLSTRIVVLLAMVMTFSLFCWAMARCDLDHVYAASLFAVLVFLPVFLRSSPQCQSK